MLSAVWAFILGFSIFISGIIALVRFERINKIYYPFLYCIWIGCLIELLTVVLYKFRLSTSITSNVYVLIESVLIMWLFRNLKVIKNPAYFFPVLIACFITLWIFENLILGNIFVIGVYFRITYSFVIVLLSIHYLNRLIGSASYLTWKNAEFLLFLGFILYFTYKALVQAFWLYGLRSSLNFLLSIQAIMGYINLVTNIIYALAVLWMPWKKPYLQQY